MDDLLRGALSPATLLLDATLQGDGVAVAATLAADELMQGECAGAPSLVYRCRVARSRSTQHTPSAHRCRPCSTGGHFGGD